LCWSQDAKTIVPPYHYDSSLTEDFPKACVEAGFEIIDCQTRNWSYTYESSKEILGDKLFYTDRIQYLFIKN